MLGMQLKTVPRERREDQEDDKHSDTARRPLFWGPSWACPARAENFGLGDSDSLLNDAQNGTHVDGKMESDGASDGIRNNSSLHQRRQQHLCNNLSFTGSMYVANYGKQR